MSERYKKQKGVSLSQSFVFFGRNTFITWQYLFPIQVFMFFMLNFTGCWPESDLEIHDEWTALTHWHHCSPTTTRCFSSSLQPQSRSIKISLIAGTTPEERKWILSLGAPPHEKGTHYEPPSRNHWWKAEGRKIAGGYSEERNRVLEITGKVSVIFCRGVEYGFGLLWEKVSKSLMWSSGSVYDSLFFPFMGGINCFSPLFPLLFRFFFPFSWGC